MSPKDIFGTLFRRVFFCKTFSFELTNHKSLDFKRGEEPTCLGVPRLIIAYVNRV